MWYFSVILFYFWKGGVPKPRNDEPGKDNPENKVKVKNRVIRVKINPLGDSSARYETRL